MNAMCARSVSVNLVLCKSTCVLNIISSFVVLRRDIHLRVKNSHEKNKMHQTFLTFLITTAPTSADKSAVVVHGTTRV